MSLLVDALNWMTDSASWAGRSGITVRVLQHLVLSASIVTIAATLALPIGILSGHLGRGGSAITLIANSARAIPTLGLLTLLGLALGIGYGAPAGALTVLAVPSLLAATHAGIRSADPVAVDAARANGMTERQIVRSVELPLASPVIVGGLRTATLLVISTATLAAYTADAGLGRFLFTGIKTQQYHIALGGAIVVASLALATDLALAAIQTYLQRRYHPAPERSTP